jgi:hypothetical protein
VAARAEGYPERTVEVTARAGVRDVVRVELVRTEDRPPVVENGDDEGSGAYPWVVGIGAGLTVVGLVTSIALTVAANGKASDAEALRASLGSDNACGAGTTRAAECQDLADTTTSKDTLHNAALGAWIGTAVVAVATTLVLVFAGPEEQSAEEARQQPSWQLVPVLTPGVAGGSVLFTY